MGPIRNPMENAIPISAYNRGRKNGKFMVRSYIVGWNIQPATDIHWKTCSLQNHQNISGKYSATLNYCTNILIKLYHNHQK